MRNRNKIRKIQGLEPLSTAKKRTEEDKDKIKVVYMKISLLKKAFMKCCEKTDRTGVYY